MTSIQRTLLAAAVLLAAPLLYAQASESAINKQIGNLRSLSDDQRPAATVKLAADIRALPAGPSKVKLADALAHLVTEGDQGADALQAVGDALSQALAQSPVPAKNDQPPMPYMDLARLVRYENVTTPLADPLYVKAGQILAANDEDIQKADFSLKDFTGKKYALSELRGKIVVVNFWATWCPPCLLEMPNLDVIYTHFQPQGLIVLSITDESTFKVFNTVNSWNYHYHPPILLDSGGKVAKQFHVDGIPRTFVFDRQGKLVAQAIDQCTQRQFLNMLAKTDLHP
ncbi:MAG: TlpA disulfide reductase family protein [Terracidiphilus sp.]|jgi:thiol-disulfide isomerase/thioredoxin